jgi:hypothetical protein
MAGALAAALIAGKAITAAAVASGVSGAQMIGGTIKSFSEAGKARRRGIKAERAVTDSLKAARRQIDVNTAERLSIPKEPYELMREAALVSGGTGLQAGVEGETRGAGATAGRMQMANLVNQSQIRSDMGKDMFEIEKLIAADDLRRREQMAGISMTEAEGAAKAVRDAEEDRAAYIKGGFKGLTAIGKQALSSYTQGNFEDADTARARRRSAEESVGVLDSQGVPVTPVTPQDEDMSGFGFDYDVDGVPGNNFPPPPPDTYVTPGGNVEAPEEGGIGFTGPPQPPTARELRQQERAARQRARQQRRAGTTSYDPVSAQMGPSSAGVGMEGEMYPGGIPAPPSSTSYNTEPMSPEERRRVRARQEYEERAGNAGGQNVAGPRVEQPVETQVEFRRRRDAEELPQPTPQQAAPSPQTSRSSVPPMTRQQQAVAAAQLQQQREMEAIMRIERAAAGMTVGMSNATITPELAAFYGVETELSPQGREGAVPPEREATGPRSVNDPTGGGSDTTSTATPRPPARDVPYPRTEEVRQSSELLQALTDNKIPVIISQPATPQVVEESNAEMRSAGEEIGPATAKMVERAIENTDPRNPLPVLMQYIGVQEPIYIPNPEGATNAKGEIIKIPTDSTGAENFEGEEFVSSFWKNLTGNSGKKIQDRLTQRDAWCAAFMNTVLLDANLTPVKGGVVNEAVALSYGSTLIGENIYTSEEGAKKTKGYLQGIANVRTNDTLEDYGGNPKAGGNLRNARIGDVVVIKGSGDGYHVTVFAGFDDEGNMLGAGGNQSNEVNITPYSADRITSIRRPEAMAMSEQDLEAVSNLLVGRDDAKEAAGRFYEEYDPTFVGPPQAPREYKKEGTAEVASTL